MGDPLQRTAAALPDAALSTKPIDSAPAAPLGGPPPGPGNHVWNAATNSWVPMPKGNWEGQATLGEQGSAFAAWSVQQGYAVLDGPSGAGGHPYNAPGIDCVAFTTSGPFRLKVIDNKTLIASTISDVSALTTNLIKNLEGELALALESRFDGIDRIADIRGSLDRAVKALRDGKPLPPEVELVVTNFGGRSANLSQKLRAQGIQLVDLRPGAGPSGGAGPVTPEPNNPGAPIHAQSVKGQAIGNGLLALGFAVHAKIRAAWAEEVLGAAAAEYARLEPYIERHRQQGHWVIVIAVLDMPKVFDVLGWEMGLAQADQKPSFVTMYFKWGRTLEEAEHPPPEPPTISAAPPDYGAPSRLLQGPAEGRVHKEFLYTGLAPYSPAGAPQP
jgi:hypothetical protein